MEAGESDLQAVQRECKEEVGFAEFGEFLGEVAPRSVPTTYRGEPSKLVVCCLVFFRATKPVLQLVSLSALALYLALPPLAAIRCFLFVEVTSFSIYQDEREVAAAGWVPLQALSGDEHVGRLNIGHTWDHAAPCVKLPVREIHYATNHNAPHGCPFFCL